MRRALLACLFGGTCLLVGWAALSQERVFAQKQENPAADGPKNFDIRLIRVGDAYQGIRFKPATGETWQITGNRWEKLAESGPVPPGDYDIILVATEEDFTALRFDRRGGTAWQLKNRKWVKVEEPQ